MFYVVAIGWMYVVLMMAVAEALAPNGSLLGALITLAFYGVLPLALVLYLLGTPARRRALREADQNSGQRSAAPMRPELPSGGDAAGVSGPAPLIDQPDGSAHATGCNQSGNVLTG